jgi:hypothetical protein
MRQYPIDEVFANSLVAEASLFLYRQTWQHLHERFGKQPPAHARHSTASLHPHTVQSTTR